MRRKMLDFVKWLVLGIIGLCIGIFSLQEPLPQIDASTSREADLWAKKIESSIDKEAWDRTDIVKWTFANHNHIWDKRRKLHLLQSNNNTTIQSLHSRKGIIQKDSKGWIHAMQKEKDRSYEAWINDSFWLNPLTKLFDEGTQRYIVESNNTKGLMVSYMKGGITPGDSYVWFTDEKNKPIRWKMWVSIIPIGGVENTWENWKKLPTGAWISTKHDFGPVSLTISNVKGGSLQDLFDQDPFAPFCSLFPEDC